jgi:hypothetical protein
LLRAQRLRRRRLVLRGGRHGLHQQGVGGVEARPQLLTLCLGGSLAATGKRETVRRRNERKARAPGVETAASVRGALAGFNGKGLARPPQRGRAPKVW